MNKINMIKLNRDSQPKSADKKNYEFNFEQLEDDNLITSQKSNPKVNLKENQSLPINNKFPVLEIHSQKNFTTNFKSPKKQTSSPSPSPTNNHSKLNLKGKNSPKIQDKEEDYIKAATIFLNDFVSIYKNISVEKKLEALSVIFKQNKLDGTDIHLSNEVKEMIITLIKEQMPKLSKSRRDTVRHTIFAIEDENPIINRDERGKANEMVVTKGSSPKVNKLQPVVINFNDLSENLSSSDIKMQASQDKLEKLDKYKNDSDKIGIKTSNKTVVTNQGFGVHKPKEIENKKKSIVQNYNISNQISKLFLLYTN